MDNDLNEKELAKNRDTAKKELETALQTIYDKPIGDLTEDDRQFLFARRQYLNRENRSIYKGILAEVEKANAEKVAKEQAELKKQGKQQVEEPKKEEKTKGSSHPADVEEDEDLDIDDEDDEEIG